MSKQNGTRFDWAITRTNQSAGVTRWTEQVGLARFATLSVVVLGRELLISLRV
jgi:hypothetical protein